VDTAASSHDAYIADFPTDNYALSQV